MGLFDSSVKQTSNSTGSTTFNKNTQRTNPQWVEDLAKGFGGEVAGLGGIDPYSLVPGADPLQAKASAGAADLSGTPWNYEAALDLTKGIATRNAPQTSAATAKGYIQDYLSPYSEQVRDAALADFDFSAGQTRAQQDLDIARSGAFGGSRSALTAAATEDALTRGRAATTADIMDRGFQTALAAAQADASRQQGANDLNAQLKGQNMDRSLGASQQIANLASQFGGEQRANIGTQSAVGAVNRDIASQIATAVPDWLGRREELFSGIPLELFGGETSTGDTQTTESSTTKKKGSGSALDKIGQVAQIAALFASDERLKADIERVGQRPDGLGIYTFAYVWDRMTRHVGLMAQEVAKVIPEAVITLPGGWLAVDYAKV